VADVLSIGISNFYEKADFEHFIGKVNTMLVLLQNEEHPYHQNKNVVGHIAKAGTVMESCF